MGVASRPAQCAHVSLTILIIVMARYSALWLATIATAGVTGTPARKSKEIAEYDDYYDSDTPVAVTCPGFPGYCSESYVGDTCTVVCARGRNNVPQCQEDGTWTDIPRCIEHDPGVEEQVTGVCPGIPGYRSLDWPGALCEFECPIGAAIRSSCTPDGTWEPYPTCDGDPRETQDGCNPCPGPDGGPRNRTIDAGSGSGRGSNNIPKGGGQSRSQNRGNSNNGGQSQGRRPSKSQSGGQSSGGQSSGGQSSGQCPGEELQACIDVCPR